MKENERHGLEDEFKDGLEERECYAGALVPYIVL